MRRLRKAWLALVAVPVLTLACSSFLHLSDPTAQSISCVVTGALLPELEALAASLGLPLYVVQALFGPACDQAARHATTQAQAEKEALASVRALATKLSAMRASFPSDGGAP